MKKIFIFVFVIFCSNAYATQNFKIPEDRSATLVTLFYASSYSDYLIFENSLLAKDHDSIEKLIRDARVFPVENEKKCVIDEWIDRQEMPPVIIFHFTGDPDNKYVTMWFAFREGRLQKGLEYK